ncbi:frigida-LIKE protein, partial [Trifolium medium]|nr:frigida-LIKE protein [Trifolium medium]
MEWGNVSLWGLNRDVSDPCPIMVKYDGLDCGPKPFRFNNFWLNNKAFYKVVEEAWNSYQSRGWMGLAPPLPTKEHSSFEYLTGP